MTYLRATGRMLLHVLLGIVLAIIYLLDRQPVDDMLRHPRRQHFGRADGILAFPGEAIVITITLQFVVAIVNTVFTLPILVALRLPHLLGFTLLCFVIACSGGGNLVSVPC